VHQIVGLRPRYSAKAKKEVNAEVFSDKGWRALSLADLFTNLEEYLRPIPKEERFNLFYTVNHTLDMKGRPFERGYIVAFDIDKISGFTESMALPISKLVCEAISVDHSKTAVVSSGNGVHILIQTDSEWTDPDYFDQARLFYKAMCDKINKILRPVYPNAKADPSIWDQARILRLPGTQNIKKDKDPVACVLIKGDLKPQHFDMAESSGMGEILPEETITLAALKAYPKPDTEEVLKSCAFLCHAKENQAAMSEPEWYAMLSVVGRVSEDHTESRKLAHAYSSGHPGYTAEDTDIKIDQALAFGPRTCASINTTWANSKCLQCPHWGKIASPLLIRGKNYIKTRESGFYFVNVGKDGVPKQGKPDTQGMQRWYEKNHPYKSTYDAGVVYTYEDGTWEEVPPKHITGFANAHFNPQSNKSTREEVLDIIRNTNQVRNKWFIESTTKKMNFINGVLDIDSMEFFPHSNKFGFRTKLPYKYDPSAKAPRFEQFMKEITLGRQELIDVLLEFAGYSLSNDECWEQKAIILYGTGLNGKSKFVEVLKALAGEKSYSSLMMDDLGREANRYQLDGALFNIAEEMPETGFSESNIFKNLVSGGEVLVKKLYTQTYSIRNRAKLWFLCNQLPRSKDTEFALFRRLIIVPFDADFRGSEDKHLGSKLIAELPGILNIVLAAYKSMKERGNITSSEIVQKQVEAYREEIDPIANFWNDNVQVTGDDSFAVASDIYSEYRIWAELNGEKLVSSPIFFKKISRLWKPYSGCSGRKTVNGRQERGIFGIKIDKAKGDF
jgi:P4 family phage/plasmid primase-like protien